MTWKARWFLLLAGIAVGVAVATVLVKSGRVAESWRAYDDLGVPPDMIEPSDGPDADVHMATEPPLEN